MPPDLRIKVKIPYVQSVISKTRLRFEISLKLYETPFACIVTPTSTVGSRSLHLAYRYVQLQNDLHHLKKRNPYLLILIYTRWIK